ncbi:hypothetical protein [Prevotella sp. KH2C16]|uniref:hypothetical protein n=1 Tax=Prevotella sp. KH2C16 TaxID=1855325 RepID=UPI0008E210E7|nr:hypothetical protein [Prevotella sp. KH2C16]SFG56517.1 hypothetical protein SAMN05216383_12063 [Prevotella sp. KH2C16]
MKQNIAKLLVRLASKIYPTYEIKPDYEAKEIAIAVAITKKNIKQYRSSCKDKTSYRKGVADMVRIQKGNNHSHIFEALEKNCLIEDKVYQKDGEKVVESRLKVYVRKSEE